MKRKSFEKPKVKRGAAKPLQKGKRKTSRVNGKAAALPEKSESIARFLARRDRELVQIVAEKDRKIAALQFELDQMSLKLEYLRRRSLEMAEFLSELRKDGIAQTSLPQYTWDALPARFQQLKDDSILFGLKKPGYEITLSPDLGRGQGSQIYTVTASLSRLCGILLYPVVEVPTCGGFLLLEIIGPDGKVVTWAKQPVDEVLPEMPVRFNFAATDIKGGEGWQLRVSANDCPAALHVLELGRDTDRIPFCGFIFHDEKAGAGQTPAVEGYLLSNIQDATRKRAVIFGAGEGGRRVMASLISSGWDIKYFVDNRREAWGTKISGIEVRDPQSLAGKDFEAIVIASKPGQRAIAEQLQKMGFVFGADFLIADV
jgi:hypothetical protein